MAIVRIRNARCGKLRLAFGVTLTPGINEVDAAVWPKCRDHPITDHYVQRGDVAEVGAASGPRSVDPTPTVKGQCEPQQPGPDAARYGDPQSPPLVLPDDGSPPSQDHPSDPIASVCVADDPSPATVGVPGLADMRAKDAIMALMTVDSVEDLRHLLRIEGRSTVIRAIERRLAELGV